MLSPPDSIGDHPDHYVTTNDRAFGKLAVMNTELPAADTQPLPGLPVAQRRIILVEDDEAVRRSLQLLLAWKGYEVLSYGTAAAAISRPSEHRECDILVVDYRLPDGDGLGVLRALRRDGWQGRAILITAFPTTTLTDSAKAGGFHAVLEKPLRKHELIGALAD